MLDGSRPTAERRLVLCAVDDLLEHGGERAALAHMEPFIPILLSNSKEASGIVPYPALSGANSQSRSASASQAGMGMAASPQQHRFTKRLLPWAGKLREAAAYGLGVCAKHGGAQFGVYAPQVVQALSEMLSAEPKVRRPLVSIQNLTCRHTNSKADCDAPAHYCHMPHMIWLVLPAYSLCLTAPWPPVPFGL